MTNKRWRVKYATEILDLLKQTWPKDVGDEITKALKQGDHAGITHAGSKNETK